MIISISWENLPFSIKQHNAVPRPKSVIKPLIIQPILTVIAVCLKDKRFGQFDSGILAIG